MDRHSRRDFLKTGLAASFAATLPAQTAKRTATDWVTLGNSGVKVTRLAFGTGTHAGAVQRALGQDGFTRLVRYAYERGIRFFDTAESYPGMPEMLATALKGIPRDNYRLMTKYTTPRPEYNTKATIDQFRKQLNTDYFDILLLHRVLHPAWMEEYARSADDLSEAKQKKIILAQGASVHGLAGLRAFPGNKWLDIAMIRMNHAGKNMDTEMGVSGPGKVDEVVEHTKKVHAQGAGVISMKLVGEGSFTDREDRRKALKFAMDQGCVDCVTIGFKSTAEIDEAIDNLNMALS